jgi:hypothetical protein
MKEFKLKRMLLLSLKEDKAREVKFNSKRTIILGRNSTGKSCLLKSIYQTFGAEPQNLHPNWRDANVISLIEFSIENETLYILRNGKNYSIFDNKANQLKAFSKVSELSEYFTTLFDFKIQLPNKKGEIVTPPPAYLLLPYYADQDKSWSANWSSFSRLYLPNAKTSIVNYHTGIRPNKYYEAKNELSLVNIGISEIDKDLAIVRSLLKNLKEKLSKIDFNIDIADFQIQITELLVSCEVLNKSQNQLKQDLTHLYNQKINLESQLIITQKALSETNSDYEFAVNNLEEVVSCPSCGADYENNFSERFGIAKDEQRCLDLIIELKEELSIVKAKIEKTNNKFSTNNRTIVDIQKQLESKKEKVKLKDVIESEGKKEIRKLFESEIREYEEELKSKLLLQKQYEADVKSFEDRKRSNRIKSDYRELMSRFLKKLNVHSLSEKSYSRIDASIKESGSAMPRALMAYYYSILHTIRKEGSSAFCPIVIDSPNQQGQDSENLPILIDFILSEQPKDSQLILALEELPDSAKIEKSDIIELTDKRSLLLKDQFEKVFSEMKPYLESIINENEAQQNV